jgi:hypothetical protein
VRDLGWNLLNQTFMGGNSVWILDGWFLIGCLSFDRQHKPSPHVCMGTNVPTDFLINRGYFLLEHLLDFVEVRVKGLRIPKTTWIRNGFPRWILVGAG